MIFDTDRTLALSHATTIDERAVPLEIFKATVTAKESEIHWELKGGSAPKVNSTPANTKKQQQKELWKNPLVLTA